MSNKTTIFLLLVLITLVLGWCYVSKRSTKVILINDTSVRLDSVLFVINNYKYTMYNVQEHSTTKIDLYLDSLITNGHDNSFHAAIYSHGKIVKRYSFYNDLRGSIESMYKMVLRKDSTFTMLLH